jgi:membrane-bound lytic murein transglycosylase A
MTTNYIIQNMSIGTTGENSKMTRMGCNKKVLTFQVLSQRIILFSAVLLIYIMMIFLGGCAEKTVIVEKEEQALWLLAKSQYPKFNDDMLFEDLVPAISKSLEYLDRVPENREFRFGLDVYDAGHLKNSLIQFRDYILKEPDGKNIDQFISENYRVYVSIGGKETGNVLYTGYYEPTLHGSLSPSSKYLHPVYGPPEDLITIDLSDFSTKFNGEKIRGRWTGKTVVPYYERKEIDFEQVLARNLKPLVYVDDIVDLFFLHVQGSGRVDLIEGYPINLRYHTANGRPYVSIGKYLIESGKIERSDMSMQKIKEYLQLHPEEINQVLSRNPSYVFFEIGSIGPVGALGVALTPGRSVATDRKVFPDAALTFIETQKPLIGLDKQIHRWIDFSRFALNQDTGGAITGAGRADLFWGNGEVAEIAAGYMQHPGNLYFLVLKPTDGR